VVVSSICLLLCFVFLSVFGRTPVTAQTQEEAQHVASKKIDQLALIQGKPVEREIAAGASHNYSIALAAGEYLHASADQRGANVRLTLFAPDERKIIEVDSPDRMQGVEPLFFVATVPGSYRLEVSTPSETTLVGRYELRIVELRQAASQDQTRAAAQALFNEAHGLSQRQAAESSQQALAKFTEALSRWQVVGDRTWEAETLNAIGAVRSDLGENQKALESFNQALSLWRAAGDRYGEALALNQAGNIKRRLSEEKTALDYFNQALSLFKTIGDRRSEASTLSNMGFVHSNLGDKQRALEHFAQALVLQRAVGDRAGQATTLNNIGVVSSNLGQYQKALDHYKEALTLYRAARDQRQEAIALSNIGVVYGWLGDNRKALDSYAQALVLQRATGARQNEAATLFNMGTAHSELGEQQKSLEHYEQALAIYRAVENRRGQAATLSSLGVTYDKLGERQKALDHFNRALAERRALGDRQGEAVTLQHIGVAHLKAHENEVALERLTESLALVRAVKHAEREASVLYNLARALRQMNKLAEARARIEEALFIIETVRAGVASRELRASYLASVRDYFEFYIDLLMRLHKENPRAGFDAAALQASERGRARSLLDTLSEAGADIRQGTAPELVERERLALRQLNAKAAAQTLLLRGKHTPEQAAAMEKEIRAHAAIYEQVEAEIRARSPRYAALTQPVPLNLGEIQRDVLDADTLLLEFALGAERSYLWAVTDKTLTTYELPGRAEIEASARRVYESLIARNERTPDETLRERQARLARAEAQFGEESARLSRMLLSPVAAQLDKKRLLIVAEGALQYVPFAALPLPKREAGKRSESPKAEGSEMKEEAPRTAASSSVSHTSSSPDTPLVVQHEIVNMPSASTLNVIRRELAGRQRASKLVAVIADPVFTADDERVTRGANNLRRTLAVEVKDANGTSGVALPPAGRFPRLPLTRLEAEAISALVPASERRQALDFEANRQTAIGAELSRYRYVHFATHGLLNSHHPELSGVILSLVDERGRAQDGFLRMPEIYNLNLPAELVVLSACQTALGKEIKGEGLVGLTRGFMYAGAPRVVASLWKIDDRATVELMKRFYAGVLGEKMQPAAALRRAQIEMWRQERWKSPYHWAAFTFQGEWR
jgi:CHAT domain-containing protein/tetratricopeptide (TPR) repeat protein